MFTAKMKIVRQQLPPRRSRRFLANKKAKKHKVFLLWPQRYIHLTKHAKAENTQKTDACRRLIPGIFCLVKEPRPS